MERRKVASTNLTGNGVTGEASHVLVSKEDDHSESNQSDDNVSNRLPVGEPELVETFNESDVADNKVNRTEIHTAEENNASKHVEMSRADESNQPKSNASRTVPKFEPSQLNVDFSRLNFDDVSNHSESIASKVNVVRETGDLEIDSFQLGRVVPGVETIHLQNDVSAPRAGESMTQLSNEHSNAEIGNELAIEPENKPRYEYIESYANELVKDGCNVNLFFLCQEVLRNKWHEKIHKIVKDASLSSRQQDNPTITIVLWNVNGPTIPKQTKMRNEKNHEIVKDASLSIRPSNSTKVTRDSERKRNGNRDAYVYGFLDENLTIEELKGIVNIQTMLPSTNPFDVGFKCQTDTTGESLEDQINKLFNRMGVVLYNDILIVSWHGPHYGLTKKQKRSNVDLMMKVVEIIRRNKECEAVIIGGDFNFEVDLIMDKYGDYDIFRPPPPSPENTHNNHTRYNIDFVVTWPKNAFICEESPKVYEGPTFTLPEGCDHVFDHNIVKYTLKRKPTKEQIPSASSSQ